MKKCIVLVFVVAALFCALIFSVGPSKLPQETERRSQEALVTDAEPIKAGVTEIDMPVGVEESSSTGAPAVAPESAIAVSPQITDTTPRPTNAVVHTAKEFGQGLADNLIVADALSLAPNVVWTGETGGVNGIFYSAEIEAGRLFNTLTVTFESETPEDSELRLAVRARFENGGWSGWQEINMDNIGFPLVLESPADAWQYRVAMSAKEVSASPRVTSVMMMPQWIASDAVQAKQP